MLRSLTLSIASLARSNSDSRDFDGLGDPGGQGVGDVFQHDGKRAGLLNCKGGKREAPRHVATLGVSVRKAWRNQRVGGALMEQAIEWAAATGIVKRIELALYARNQAVSLAPGCPHPFVLISLLC